MKKTAGSIVLCLMIAVLSVCLPFHAAAEAAGETEPPFIDLDMSVMSGTVVYAQVYNLTVDPDPWLGKIIRIAGYYSCFNDTDRGIVYHACIIPDATGCCAQGIEFIWAGEHVWPDDYPEAGTDLTVTGRLEMYEEDGDPYLHLVDAEVIWENLP